MNINGIYGLCIHVKKDLEVIVGALGALSFISGKYVYVGSALNGLKARIKRHIETSRGFKKTLHWHIDYLLKENDVVIKDIYILETNKRQECLLADFISMKGKQVLGFGSSDCRCKSHLIRVDEWEHLVDFGLKRLNLDFSKVILNL